MKESEKQSIENKKETERTHAQTESHKIKQKLIVFQNPNTHVRKMKNKIVFSS